VFSDLDERAFRESAFAWLRARTLIKPALSREDLSHFIFQGREFRLLGPFTGIWKPKEMSSAVAFSTGFYSDENKRPYHDHMGSDGMLRYKWQGDDANHADQVALRTAMQRGDDLIYFVGVGYEGNRQVYDPVFPVRLVAEEPDQQQFVVSLGAEQSYAGADSSAQVIEITKRYNERLVKTRLHQPVFRTQVTLAYEYRCAVCRLPFLELLDAAHIKSDADGGAAIVTNGLALCKIHHGAFDTNLMGISPDYKISIRQSVLETFDGPTLQHSLKEMNGEKLRQLPPRKEQLPDSDLLAERFEEFNKAS
jgi:putative restriction endonuclease